MLKGKKQRRGKKWDGEVHWVFLKCRHLSHGDTSERGRSRGCRLTNLQIPVDYPINMAVMDALQDLLYAVTEGKKSPEQVQDCDGAMEKKEREKERRDTERRRLIRETVSEQFSCISSVDVGCTVLLNDTEPCLHIVLQSILCDPITMSQALTPLAHESPLEPFCEEIQLASTICK